ncbi:MAG TPA: SEC-C metal-binding domain-containing protein, partial [Acidimicrobiales bacterium]|nr:SEC-C metal-binding domain-containing protein [Acidimicrobiales bacterium]
KYSAAEEPVQGPRGMAVASSSNGGAAPAPAVADDTPELQQPVVKSEWDKTPRNAPCPCGSGKKFKLCHGR